MSITKLNNLSLSAVTALPSGVGGKVLQVINTVKTDTFLTTSQSYVIITGLTATITPSSASNKILVMATVHSGSAAGSNAGGAFRLYRDGSNITAVNGDSAGSRTTAWGQAAAPGTSPWYSKISTLIYLHSPLTTSSTTYQIYVRAEDTSGGTSVNYTSSDDSDGSDRTRAVSTITLMEIAG